MSEDTAIRQAQLTIDAEIEALQAMRARMSCSFGTAIRLILETKGRVVVMGMGKSGIVGQKIAATLASTGTPAFFVHPGEAFHGDLGMIKPSDVALLISNSGETEEVIRVLPFLEHQKNQIVAMTGKPGSTLARMAHAVLDVGVEREACNNNLAPTSSTTCTLVMGDALAVSLSMERDFQPEDFARFHPGGSLGRKLLTRVADIMHKPPLPWCPPDASFREVVHTITRGRLGLVLVMADRQLIGLITDGDVRRAFDSDRDYKTIDAAQMMTRDPKTVLPGMRFADAEAKMRENKINAVVVRDEGGSVAGVLQIYDFAEEEAGL
jgi:arabinose-5-phosphate isomerase